MPAPISKNKNKTVFVGLSGGVDSSVSAYLLKKEGFNVIGAHIRGYNVDGCGELDAESARLSAGHLGIPFYVFDMEEEYKSAVVEYMVSSYKKGITPNPDVACNREIKFGLFLKKALTLGADYVATGHYARIKNIKGVPHLFAGLDKEKDQSYFLWDISRDLLKYCLFPLGGLKKPEVRRIAKKAGLPNAERKDSQGVCFLGKIGLYDFLKGYLGEKPGEIITTDGNNIGEHRGLHFYTIGQRHLGLKGISAGRKGEDSAPLYVAEKDIKNNTLILAEGDDNPALYKTEVRLEHLNFLSGEAEKNKKSLPCLARIRYREPLSEAVLSVSGNSAKLVFTNPRKFVAPGQSAVLYSASHEMLAGGIISSVRQPVE